MERKKINKEEGGERIKTPTFTEFSNYCQQRKYWICHKKGEIERFYNVLNSRGWKSANGEKVKSWQSLTSRALRPICGEIPSGLLFNVPTREEFEDLCRNGFGGVFIAHPDAISRVWSFCQTDKWAFARNEEITSARTWQDYVTEKIGICKEYLNRLWKEAEARKVEKDNSSFVYKITHKKLSEYDIDKSDNHFVCYTDGSCDNLTKPHVGGSAYIVIKNEDVIHTASHGTVHTTNNRMEMLAIISAAYHCPVNSIVDIYSDSQYAIKVLSGEWKHKMNADLFHKFSECARHLQAVRFFWVKGHNGYKYNELADELAYGAYCDKCKELGVKPSNRH